MIVGIEVEDEAWRSVPDLERLAERSVFAACEASGLDGDVAVTLLFTDDATMAGMNGRWRGKAGATNVLSFAAARDLIVPPGEARVLGDIVLASGVVMREAEEQAKPLPAHVSHLIVHGLLHLLGHDHQTTDEAAAMETREIAVLNRLGIENPYDPN